MKTLYININNEEIQSNEELEVLKHDLDNDFFFYLGEKIAKGCKVENEIALITDFNTQDHEAEYKQIIAQWNEIKTILFSEECEGEFDITLPNGYIHWLCYNGKYNSIYDRHFSHGESTVITIDLEELYEDSVKDLQHEILCNLQRDDLYLEIDEIVFNDDAVTHESSIVKMLKNKYGGIRFCHYKKYNEKTAIILIEQPKLNRPQLRNDAKIAPQKNKSLENVHPKSPKQLSSKNSYGCSQGYSWQTDEYLAIINHDKKKYLEKQNKNLKKELDAGTDTAGNKISQYLEVFNLIIGESTKYEAYKQLGKVDDSHRFKLPNGSFVRFYGQDVIYCAEFENNIPQFYKKIGCYWGMKGTEFIGIFEKLGFCCVKNAYGYIRATRKCKNGCNLEVKVTYKNYGNEDMMSFKISFE